MRTYWVYIMSNQAKCLYTGMTGDLHRRVYQHKKKLLPGFSSRYNFHLLVFFESTSDARVALNREKQIKGWSRRKKLELIRGSNPAWEDLAKDWYDSTI